MGDETRDIFVRQRRNLLAMSLVLLVADIHNDIHLGAVTVSVHAPFTITMVLWVVWGYWLWRYYTSFHDLGERGFFRRYRERLQNLVQDIGIKRIVAGDRAEYRTAHDGFREMNPSGTRALMVFNSHYAVGSPSYRRASLNLRLGMKDSDGILATEELKPPEQQVTVEGLGFFITSARAWAYVIFLTTLFSEYLLPFLFAFAVLLYAVYVGVSHAT